MSNKIKVISLLSDVKAPNNRGLKNASFLNFLQHSASLSTSYCGNMLDFILQFQKVLTKRHVAFLTKGLSAVFLAAYYFALFFRLVSLSHLAA